MFSCKIYFKPRTTLLTIIFLDELQYIEYSNEFYIGLEMEDESNFKNTLRTSKYYENKSNSLIKKGYLISTMTNVFILGNIKKNYIKVRVFIDESNGQTYIQAITKNNKTKTTKTITKLNGSKKHNDLIKLLIDTGRQHVFNNIYTAKVSNIKKIVEKI